VALATFESLRLHRREKEYLKSRSLPGENSFSGISFGRLLLPTVGTLRGSFRSIPPPALFKYSASVTTTLGEESPYAD